LIDFNDRVLDDVLEHVGQAAFGSMPLSSVVPIGEGATTASKYR
jgi:hypothetical protein